MSSRLIGVGVGPGDPGLLTLKAIAALGEADVVAHFAKAGNASNARTIVAEHLKDGVEELPLLYPVTTEIPKEDAAYRDAIRAFYDSAAEAVAEPHPRRGRSPPWRSGFWMPSPLGRPCFQHRPGFGPRGLRSRIPGGGQGG